jgi:hypothetical protein
MSKVHYTIKNTLGGSFCKKCFNWSSEPDGLKDYECTATNKEKKLNKQIFKK